MEEGPILLFSQLLSPKIVAWYSVNRHLSFNMTENEDFIS